MNEDLQNNNNQTKTTFSTGAVRDVSSNKEDYIETISYIALQRYAKYMTSKQSVYGAGNWRKGIPISSYEKSLMRHLQKYFANKYEDANLEPNEDHLAAAMFNLQGLMHEQEKEKATRTTEMVNELSEGGTTISGTDQGGIDGVLSELGGSLEKSANTKPLSNRGVRAQRLARIKELYSEGFTIIEIANQIGVSERTVYRRLQALGNKS
jgi:hypothetical protein